VLFHYNSTKLTKKSKANLRFLAPLLVNTKEIALYGYTQTNLKSRASKLANKILAKRRTIAVRKFLKGLGVTGTFKLIGKGAVKPVSKKHQYKNRRVTIKVKYLPPTVV
jgi:outer membrane protein OmpA-like peptidoglycan-associated protein